jgi:WD40 repeat protein
MKTLHVLTLCALCAGCSDAPSADRPGGKGDRGRGAADRALYVSIRAAAVSPNGKRALVGYQASLRDYRGYLKLWDVSTGKEVRPLFGQNCRATFVAFLPDGKRAVSAGEDGLLNIHNLDTGELLRSIVAYRGWVDCGALAPDGKFALTSGGKSGILKFWDLEKGQLVRAFAEPADPQHSLAVSSDNRLALSGTSPVLQGDKELTRLKLWDVTTGRVIRFFEAEDGWGGPVAFSPDAKLALSLKSKRVAGSGSWESHLVLWEVASGKFVRRLEGWGTNPAGFTPDGKRVYGLTNDSTPAGGRYTVRYWDVASGQQARAVPLETGLTKEGGRRPVRPASPADVSAWAVSADGRWLLAATGHNEEFGNFVDLKVKVWDLDKGVLQRGWDDPTLHQPEP